MNITNLLSGTKILEKTHSRYNGEIEVIRDFTWGTRISVNGLTQSGGILKQIWQSSLKKVLTQKPVVKNCLILGLGGGSVAKLVSQFWVTAKITGVDIDEKIVELGTRHLGLDTSKVKVIIQDASDYLTTSDSYDLIIVDLYCGDKFPEKFEKDDFVNGIKNLLAKDGIAVFNRLYGPTDRSASMKFGRKLEKVFKKVDYVYPMANVMFVCYN